MALWIPWKLLIFVFMIVLPKLTWTTPSVSFSLIIPRMTFYHHHLVGAVIRSLRTYKPRLSNSINLQGKLRSLKTPSPKEILKIFCEGIFKENTNVILHINNPALLGRQMASTEYILQLSHSIGIPLISWNPDFSFVASRVPNDSLVLQIAPSVFHQCEAMMDLLDRYNWTDFTIIATTSEGHQDFILSLRKLAAEKSRSFSNLPEKGKSIDYEKKFRIIREILIQNKTTESIYQHLSTLVDTETRVILLYATRRDTLDIMEMAAELKLTEPKYIWIVTEISLVARSSSRPPRALPTGLLGISYNSSIDTMKIVISQAIDIWTRALQAISRHPQLMANITLQPNMSCDGAGSLHWDDGKVLYRFMKNVTIRGEGGQMNQFKADHSLKYVELKILNLNQEREWKEVGKWNQNGLTMYDITWPGNSPTPPKGRPEKFFMRVVTLDEIPYVRYLDVNELGKCGHNSVPCRVKKDIIQPNGDRIVTNETINKCCTGLCIDILKILSKRIGFDYDLFEVEDKIWGSKQPDGQWNGLVRSVLDGKADMVMTSTKITPERNKAIDFSLPFLETGITIIVAIREGAVSPTAFLEPFDLTSWILILLLCIHAVALLVYMSEWYSPLGLDRGRYEGEPYDYPAWCLILVFSVHATGASIFIFEWLSPFGLHQGKTPIREHKFSLFRSFWLIWAMLFGASVNTDNPRGVSSRFLANVWALFALVFLASYTANLAAFMITKEEFYDLSGIQDWRLMNPYALKPPFRFATVPNGSTETNLNKNYPKMYQYMQQFNKRNVKEGVESLKKNSIDAFIYDATVLEYRAGQDDMCKLRTVGKWYAMTGYGVAFPRGSKWINQVNQILLELQHNGEMERLQKFWLAGACKKQDQTGESSHSLGILNFTSAFILLAGGMVLGSLLLALEHLYFKFGRKSLQKWDKCGCCGLVSLSMGKSLTFEQSVREAIEQRKRHRCKDPICETQLWKARHELDLALLKIDKLQDQITTIGLTPEPGAVWKLQSVYQPLVREPPKMIKCKTEPSTPEKENPEPEGRDKAEVTPPSSAPEWRKNPPVDKQAFRRSPSYTTAMAVSDDPKQTGKTRYHNGNYYVEVDNMEIESVL